MTDDKKPDCPEPANKGFINACLGPFGIHTDKKWYHIRLTGRFFIIVGCFFFVILVLTVATFNYTTHPEFCTTCHIMEPYYEAWKTSTHKDYATCVDCHYPKGMGILPQKMRAMSQLVQYVTRTYRPRPRAEVPDKNCLQKGCHESRLLKGKIETKEGILFDHTPHLTQVRRGKQLKCTSCHSQIVIGTHIQVTYNTCYLCHFRGHKPTRDELPLGGCKSCHLPPKDEITLANGDSFTHSDYINNDGVKCIDCHLDSIAGDGKAPKELCYTCHNQPDRIAMYDDLDFIHQNHVATHKIECNACHLQIEHKIGAAKPDHGTCVQCHPNDHNATRMLYGGEWPENDATKKTAPEPASMNAAHVQCIACHTHDVNAGEFSNSHYAPDPKNCDRCHGEGTSDFVDVWKSDIDGEIQSFDTKIQALDAMLKAGGYPDDMKKEIRDMLESARRRSNFIKAAHGVHNYDLTLEKLSDAESAIDEIIKSAAPPTPKQ